MYILVNRIEETMEEKKSKEFADRDLDWEYTSEFYQEKPSDRPLRTLEEYLSEKTILSGENQPEDTLTKSSEDYELLSQTIQDVRTVRILSTESHSVPEICSQTGLSKDYVLRILMTLEGYAEDNDLAIAHLVLLG